MINRELAAENLGDPMDIIAKLQQAELMTDLGHTDDFGASITEEGRSLLGDLVMCGYGSDIRIMARKEDKFVVVDCTEGPFTARFVSAGRIRTGEVLDDGEIEVKSRYGVVMREVQALGNTFWVGVGEDVGLENPFRVLGESPLARRVYDLCVGRPVDVELLARLCQQIPNDVRQMWLFEAFINNLLTPAECMAELFMTLPKKEPGYIAPRIVGIGSNFSIHYSTYPDQKIGDGTAAPTCSLNFSNNAGTYELAPGFFGYTLPEPIN